MINLMGDYGIKIAKDGKSIRSSDSADYLYWSKYNGLSLLEEYDLTFNVEDATSGSATYTHNLGYAPFVIAQFTGVPTGWPILIRDEVLPVNLSFGLSGGTYSAYDPFAMTSFTPVFSSVILTFDVTDTQVTVNWFVQAFQGGGGFSGYFTNWSGGNIDYTVTLSLYSFDMNRIIS